MSAASVEKRLAVLEAEVARLKEQIANKPKKDWVEVIWGSFANDPIYEEAMKLGRAYREEQRPQPKKRKQR